MQHEVDKRDKKQTQLPSLNIRNFLLNEEEAEINAIFVKKNKVIKNTNFLSRLTLKLSLAYLCFVLATASASLAFHLMFKASVDSLKSAIEGGQLIVNDFSNSQVLMILVKEQYYDQV